MRAAYLPVRLPCAPGVQIEVVLQPLMTHAHQNCKYWGKSGSVFGGFLLVVKQVECSFRSSFHPSRRTNGVNKLFRVEVNPMPDGFAQGHCYGNLRVSLHAEQKG